MRDFCIEHDDTSDSIAPIGEVLGAAGVNIEGLCFVRSNGRSVVHFAVEDAMTARRVLEHSGIRIKEVSEVYVLYKDKKRVTGKPGSFGEICRTFADNGITLNFGYAAENNRFIFGVADIAKAQELLGQ
jgi:hypothetical protein